MAIMLLSACAEGEQGIHSASGTALPTVVSSTLNLENPEETKEQATRSVPLTGGTELVTSAATVTSTGEAPEPSSGTMQGGNVDGLRLPDGFRAERYAEGLRSPTAMAFGAGGKLYLTQLNGGENQGAGQVVMLDGPGAKPVVVLEKLLKPTGLAWSGDRLYVMTQRDVLRASGVDGVLQPPEAIVRDLPNNGRSEGQIDLLPDGRILFEASGAIGDAGSGKLFVLDAAERSVVLAAGLKNAYATAFDARSGRLFATEIGDDPVDGKAPPEEINLIEAGGDYGWPRCYAGKIPASDQGGTAEICAGTRAPLVTFPPHTTPTGLAFYDGADFPTGFRDALYAALLNASPPVVMRVELSGEGDDVTSRATEFIGGLKRPIDLLRDPRGGLLVLDFEAGVVYRITTQ